MTTPGAAPEDQKMACQLVALHIYSISAYSSSLNQGERLLDKITDKSLRRNAFVGDRQFVRRFDRFVAHRTACKFPTPR
jgi:hypothetical protein